MAVSGLQRSLTVCVQCDVSLFPAAVGSRESRDTLELHGTETQPPAARLLRGPHTRTGESLPAVSSLMDFSPEAAAVGEPEEHFAFCQEAPREVNTQHTLALSRAAPQFQNAIATR